MHVTTTSTPNEPAKSWSGELRAARSSTTDHQLGRYSLADKTVWRVGFGAMQLSGDPNFLGATAKPDRNEAIGVLRAAIDAGVDHIDTAQFYGNGRSNTLIREALHPYPEQLALVSKVVARAGGSGWPGERVEYPELRQGIIDNLTTLRAERLTVVNLRVTDDRGPDARFIDQVGALADAQAESLIGGIGLSNISHTHLVEALKVADIVCVQNFFNLEGRSSEAVLQECRARAIAFVPFCPLGYPRDQHERITNHANVLAVAAAHDATPTQIALAWLLKIAPNVLLIPGTRRRTHLDENLRADGISLTEYDMAALEEL